jgi:hypothetical protein
MPRITGVYKIVAGSDPLFPAASGHEWFFDFGRGMAQGKQSGKVSVSLRRNPAVQVRIMVWQVVPKQRRLLLGNTDAEGSNRAVARADWRVTQQSDAVVLERDGHRLVLQRPEPGDY